MISQKNSYFQYLMQSATRNMEDQTVNAAYTQAQIEGSKNIAKKIENSLKRPKTIPEKMESRNRQKS